MRFKEFNKKFFSTLNNRVEIKFINDAVMININGNTIAKITLNCNKTLQKYDSYKVEIINKINGIVDTMIFNFDEYFKSNNPEQQFYIWEKLDEIKWNGNINPTVKEIKKFNNEIIEFINMYSEGTNFIAFVS